MNLLSAGDPIRDYILAHQVATGVAGVVLLVVIGVVTGIVRTVLTDFGFRLDRTGVGLRRRRGLLTRTDVTLPVSRAQAALVASGPVRDRFGWRELRLQSLAKDEGSKGAHVVAPLARDKKSLGSLASWAGRHFRSRSTGFAFRGPMSRRSRRRWRRFTWPRLPTWSLSRRSAQ